MSAAVRCCSAACLGCATCLPGDPEGTCSLCRDAFTLDDDQARQDFGTPVTCGDCDAWAFAALLFLTGTLFARTVPPCAHCEHPARPGVTCAHCLGAHCGDVLCGCALDTEEFAQVCDAHRDGWMADLDRAHPAPVVEIAHPARQEAA